MYRALAEPAEGGAVWTSDLAGRVQRWAPDPSGYRLDRTVHVSDAVARLQLADQGRALLIIDKDQTMWLDTTRPDQSRRVDITPLRPATLRCLDAVDDGRGLMAIDETGTVRRMDLPSGRCEVVLASAVNGAALSQKSPESIAGARFSPQGQWVWVQQLAGPVLLHLHTGGKTSVKADRGAAGVAFGPRGDCLATASSRTLSVWEVDSAREIMKIDNKTSLLDAATFLADGRLLVVGVRSLEAPAPGEAEND
jgi:dipeptidyl aminopeptidase/acylaminoacyl peptidase